MIRSSVAAVLMVLVAGCGPSMRYGSPVPFDKLKSLKAGVSGPSEVRAALGEPRGSGVSRIVPDPKSRRTLWYYEYTKVETKIDLQILLVFFKDHKYDGNLWFASGELPNRPGP